MKRLILAVSLLAVSLSQPAFAGEKKVFVVVNDAVGVPVFPYDFKDRPYEVLGEVKAGVRKATAFSKSPSQAKIYRELWERAEKLGADAVINASYGDARMTAFSWGKADAKGTAIRFKPAATPPVMPAAAEPATKSEPAQPAEPAAATDPAGR